MRKDLHDSATAVIYDSVHGNTEKIALAIGKVVVGSAVTLRVSKVSANDLEGLDMLIVGSPTHIGMPTRPMQDFLASLHEPALRGVRAAAFDTRYSSDMVKIFGFAAVEIARAVVSKGGKMVAEPQGFYVSGREGPLREGEVERAKAWASSLAKSG